MEEFGRIAKNPEATDKVMKEIREAFGMDLLMFSGEEYDYE